MDTKPKSKKLLGVAGFFNGPEALLEAMKQAKAAKYPCVDAFSPFPIHGMDDAQGLKRSNLPYVTFTFGAIGLITAFSLQYITSAVGEPYLHLGDWLFTLRGWPLNVGGKPFNSWPAFVPILFELTVLFAGISTVFGMFAFNRLPNIFKKAFDPGITSNRFALLIEKPCCSKKECKEGNASQFDEGQVQGFLKKIGATETKTVYQEGWFS